jgi:hypothetical protein
VIAEKLNSDVIASAKRGVSERSCQASDEGYSAIFLIKSVIRKARLEFKMAEGSQTVKIFENIKNRARKVATIGQTMTEM